MCIFIQRASVRDAIAVTPELWSGEKKKNQNMQDNKVQRPGTTAILSALQLKYRTNTVLFLWINKKFLFKIEYDIIVSDEW